MTTRLFLLAIQHDSAKADDPYDWNWGDPGTLDPEVWRAASVSSEASFYRVDDGGEYPIVSLANIGRATHVGCGWVGCNTRLPLVRLIHPYPHGMMDGLPLCADHASEAGDLKAGAS